MRVLIRLLAVLSVFLAGCDSDAMFDKFVPKEESQVAIDLVNKLGAKDYAAVERRLGADLRTPDLRDKLEAMVQVMPTAPALSSRVIGSDTTKEVSKDSTSYRFTLEFQYPQSWLLATVVLERKGGVLTLEGIHVLPRATSLVAENRFTFAGKGPLHYFVFVLAIAIPLFIVATLVVCARTPIAKRKWLWIVFIVLGVVQFHLDWTTGGWNVQPIAFSLLGAGFVKAGPAAPVIFTLAFPLGAVVFLLRRRAILARVNAAPLRERPDASAVQNET